MNGVYYSLRSLARFILLIAFLYILLSIGVSYLSLDLATVCLADGSLAILNEWRTNHKLVCSADGGGATQTRIEQFVLSPWEYTPTVTRYTNVHLASWDAPLPKTCPVVNPSVNLPEDFSNTTVIRMQLHERFNAYERFHAYLNVAMIIMMFNIVSPQLVMLSTNGGSVSGDMEMWRSFSNLEPIFIDKMQGFRTVDEKEKGRSLPTKSLCIRELITPSTASSSMLVTKSKHGAFMGRGTDHHCKSAIFRKIIHQMTFGLGIAEPDHDTSAPIQIIFSTRPPYCCRPVGKIYIPARSINNLDGMVTALGKTLGSRYNITQVNFGNRTTYDSVHLSTHADIIIGTHGAGLVCYLSIQSSRCYSTHECTSCYSTNLQGHVSPLLISTRRQV